MTKVVKRTAPKRVRIESFKNITIENLVECTNDELVLWAVGIEKLTKSNENIEKIHAYIKERLVNANKEGNEVEEITKDSVDTSIPAENLDSVNVEILEEVAPEKVVAKAKKKASASKKAKETKKESKKKAPVSKKGETKPGIIATILAVLMTSGSKGVTKEQILDNLINKFPDREESKMKATVTVQVPGRIAREKGIEIEKLEGGFYRVKK